MNSVQQAIAEMNTRLASVETRLSRLNKEISEGNSRQQAALARMKDRAESMRNDSEAMRKDSEAMRKDSEAMRKDSESMRQASEDMDRNVARNTAAFDQATAQMVDDLQKYRGGIAIVVEHLVKKDAEHDAQHADLARRVDAIERKLAG